MALSTTKVGLENLTEIVDFDFQVFDGMYEHVPYDLAHYEEKLKDKNPIIYITRDGDKIVADVIAYERDNSIYIWIMAVDKDYRGQGIASNYFDLIENLSNEKGLNLVTIKTHNVNKEIFAMLIKRGYKVYDFKKSDSNIEYNAIRLKKFV